MAHIKRISSLTAELITLITGFSSQDIPSRFDAYYESTLRTLRSNNYTRTNPFDVQGQLEGLEEKLRIYNKDDIADALRKRLDELAKRKQKWTPEIFHLLLGLSDKPVVKSELASLEITEPTEERSPFGYKWEDLVAEDSLLRDKLVWQNIDYGADTSDDELSVNSDPETPSVPESTAISSNYNESLFRSKNEFTVHPDLVQLDTLEGAQFWREKRADGKADDRDGYESSSVIFITELQAIREVLFMLSGFDTSLFVDHRKCDRGALVRDDLSYQIVSRLSTGTEEKDFVEEHITPAPRYALKGVSTEVFHGILTQIAQYGSSVQAIRAWIRTKQFISLLQSLQAVLMIRVARFDRIISEMQSSYIDSSQDIIISLIEIYAKVTTLVYPLLEISNIIKVLDRENYAHAFRFLELLYDRTCACQMAGNGDLYEYLGTIFFDCFQSYLRQIRQWMEEGELSKNDRVFFVSENNRNPELAALWVERYKLRKTSNGALHAPKFLHPASSKIFTTGKSVVVLKILRKYDRAHWLTSMPEPILDFRTVCGSPSISLAPFSELFDVAFHQWIRSKHHITSSALRKTLFDDCGLRDSLKALEYIYFMANGATTSLFANALFKNLDSRRSNWNDRFTVTELVQRTMGSLPGVVAERLKVSVSTTNQTKVKISHESVRSLDTIAVTYSLPWPIQIIIAKESILSYQKIFSLLLQIRRSTYVLQGIRLVQTDGRGPENMFYGVRSRLLWFTSTLYSYLTDLVIEPNTVDMRKALVEENDVDYMIETHRGYLKKLIDQALLGSKLAPIHKSIISILDLAVQLVDADTVSTSVQNEANNSPASRHTILSHKSSYQTPKVRQKRLQEERQTDLSDEDDGVSESVADADLSHTEPMSKIRDQFDSLCKFVATGLRSIARAGGEPNWDILADKLESGLGFATQRWTA